MIGKTQKVVQMICIGKASRMHVEGFIESQPVKCLGESLFFFFEVIARTLFDVRKL